MFRRILVPTDGSAASMTAVDVAVALAHRSRAQLFGLHVKPRRAWLGKLAGKVVAPEYPDRSHEFLGYVERRAAQAGIAGSAHVLHADDPHEAIRAAARDFGCDLIVMASHGRGPVQSLLLGSQAQQVLAHSAIPVLVVPRPDTYSS